MSDHRIRWRLNTVRAWENVGDAFFADILECAIRYLALRSVVSDAAQPNGFADSQITAVATDSEGEDCAALTLFRSERDGLEYANGIVWEKQPGSLRVPHRTAMYDHS